MLVTLVDNLNLYFMTLSVTRYDVTLCRAVVYDAAQHDVARPQFKAGADRYDDLRFPRNLLG